jgi:hypothetical protein
MQHWWNEMTGLGLNSSLQGVTPATNHLTHGTAIFLTKFLNTYVEQPSIEYFKICGFVISCI